MESFAAAPGWDAVTGLGSPNFEVISRIVLNLNAVYPSLHDESSSTLKTVDNNNMQEELGSTAQHQSVDTTSLAIAAIVLGCVSTVLAAIGLYIALRGASTNAVNSKRAQYGEQQFKLSSASNSFLLDESS